MKIVAITVLAILLIGIFWNIQAKRNPYVRHANYPFLWFAAIKLGNQPTPGFNPEQGVKVTWQVSADLTFIGGTDVEPYWDSFILLGSHNHVTRPLEFNDSIEDAYLVRLEPYKAPPIILSLFSFLHKLGIWSKPDGEATRNVDLSIIRPGIGPTQNNVDAMFTKPFEQKPFMVNFLKFSSRARYPESSDVENPLVSGRAAYDRYGDIANKTVYSVGGEYVLGGYVTEVLRAAKGGLTAADWDDIAVMQYPNQTAILLMEKVEEYRSALKHRDAGLERTVIVSALD